MTATEKAVRQRAVLVTGAGGFIGANLVWTLHEHGFRVRAMVRRPPTGPQWAGLDGVEFVLGDVTDPGHVARAVAGVGAVIHSAALTRLVPHPRSEAYRVNVGGTRNVCAAALKAGVRRLVFTSSAATVSPGTAEQPGTEDTPGQALRSPIHAPYYSSKRWAERVVHAYSAQGLETITLLPAFVIGPRDVRPTTNELLLYAARTRWAFLPPGGMGVIDVRETALAHVRALWLGEPGERYLLAGPYMRYVELAALVHRILNVYGSIHVLPGWMHPPGASALALLAGVWPDLPNGLTLPSYHYGFVENHLSGARADQAFQLTHRRIEESVQDTLCWFRDAGVAPWLAEHLPESGTAEVPRREKSDSGLPLSFAEGAHQFA
jgi:dihydroflavonol-4-reductase